jgi:hypothetical protein
LTTGPALVEQHPASGQSGGQLAHQHLAGGGRLLEAGGHVHGVADHRGLPVDQRRDHDLAGVDADGEGEVAAHLPHGQARGHRPLGVVVVGGGDPEHGEQRVAHVLVDRPAVVGHDLTEAPEGGVHRAGHGLGVGALGQRGEPHHVGEEDGGQLALLHGHRGRRRRTLQRRAALAAEVRPLRVQRRARRAAEAGQRRPAAAAEAGGGGIGRTACPARPHPPDSRR